MMVFTIRAIMEVIGHPEQHVNDVSSLLSYFEETYRALKKEGLQFFILGGRYFSQQSCITELAMLLIYLLRISFSLGDTVRQALLSTISHLYLRILLSKLIPKKLVSKYLKELDHGR